MVSLVTYRGNSLINAIMVITKITSPEFAIKLYIGISLLTKNEA